MVRTLFLLAAVMVLISGEAVCAQGSGAADRLMSGPLDLRPSSRRANAPASKPVAKPQKRKKPAPAPVARSPAPQPDERAPVLTVASIRAPVVVEKAQEKAAVAETVKQPAEARAPFDDYVITQFCTSLSSAASDGRLAWQAKRFEEMEARLRERVAELESKRLETDDWLKRREEAQRKADESVVAIYSKMKPDAAAAQFSAMDESGAAAILSKLNPRAAGTILNEIDASRAARIAAEMAGVGQRREAVRMVR